MLMCNSRDMMKRHLTTRLDMLRGQKDYAERREGRKQFDTAARIEGIQEALDLIEAWEHADATVGLEDSIMEQLSSTKGA